ncbi:D-psicose 3-epimerase [Gluconobacter thailandicus]|uniref:Sugar phosphate isomerase/epimerase n=1 Tax=Gluconobacter thailandicus TaxID=257438 RepID=A0AAP9EPR7_GLUTH|nr:sugar phosphate isomerase/epimerase family protein [Gluconobacter thailandicus]QEH95259.1 sugar phosphate isomerase/epimerase [Gluconobacter thailandicus]
MKFGTLFSYWSHDWNTDLSNYIRIARKVSEIGFDILEVSADHLYHFSEDDLKRLNDARLKHGLTFTVNSGPAKKYDLASKQESVREDGIAYFKAIFDKMKSVEAISLAGAIYSYWPADFSDTDKDGAWLRSIASLKSVARDAENAGVTVSLEVLNRNESYILNTAAEGLDYRDRIGSDAVKLLLDTYHMNIEEDSTPDAIRATGRWLGHFHIGENNRKLPGMNGTIDWNAVGTALRDIRYDGAVVMEPFLLAGGTVGHSIRLWRDLSDAADERQLDRLISDSLAFVKKNFL